PLPGLPAPHQQRVRRSGTVPGRCGGDPRRQHDLRARRRFRRACALPLLPGLRGHGVLRARGAAGGGGDSHRRVRRSGFPATLRLGVRGAQARLGGAAGGDRTPPLNGPQAIAHAGAGGMTQRRASAATSCRRTRIRRCWRASLWRCASGCSAGPASASARPVPPCWANPTHSPPGARRPRRRSIRARAARARRVATPTRTRTGTPLRAVRDDGGGDGRARLRLEAFAGGRCARVLQVAIERGGSDNRACARLHRRTGRQTCRQAPRDVHERRPPRCAIEVADEPRPADGLMAPDPTGSRRVAEGLERYVEAQEGVFERALGEIRNGLKRGHWIWFVFPQLPGLGRSPQSAYYGIRGLDEARRYLAHPVLGPRLDAATRAVLQAGQPPRRIFGELEAMKFASSMTLFARASPPGSVYHEALHLAGGRDALTLDLLARDGDGGEALAAPRGFPNVAARPRRVVSPAEGAIRHRMLRPAMSFETFRFPPPLPPPVQQGPPPSRPSDPGGAGFHEDLLAADPAEVGFALDHASVRIQDEREDQWNTHWSASGAMSVSAPGADAQVVPLRYSATMRNEHATPEGMRVLNPFDPSTIPPRTRIDVRGRDYAGTPMEASFRAMAEANGLASIEDLRLSLEMTADGELRVMTGSNRLFDAPRDGGPASAPAAREDFIRHTAMLD